MTSTLPETPQPDHSSASTTESVSTVTLFAGLCEEFTARLKHAKEASIDEYIERYPELASEIRTAFPALQMMHAVQANSDAGEMPATIAGCEIIRCIGSGGMGIVYEAKHPNVSRRIAIKVLKPQHQKITDLRERFLREAEATSRLNHPHIVPFIDYGHDGEAAYLSMPLIDGHGLDDFLNRFWDRSDTSTQGSESPSHSPNHGSNFVAHDFTTIARIGADVASALAHAHQRNTIHRDIKPANLILDQDGKVWVTDFGLAKISDDEHNLSQTGDMIGTPRYMAPEQFRGLADERSDIYALGVTLYELVTGTRAWNTKSHTAAINRGSAELPAVLKVNAGVPRPLAKIISRACSSSPRKRYQCAEDMQFELNQFAHGEAVVDRRSGHRGKTVAQTVAQTLQQPLWMASLSVLVALATIRFATRSAQHQPDRPALIASEDSLPEQPNQPPVVTSTPSRVVTMEEGLTAVPVPVLTGHDPDGQPFFWRLSESPDRPHFFCHAISGQLCFRTPPSFSHPVDADQDNNYQLRLVADDSLQPHIAVITQRPGDLTTWLSEPAIGVRRKVHLPANLIAISTNDGHSYLHFHRSLDGTVAMYRSTVTDSAQMPADPLQTDCHLSPMTRGLTNVEGRRWLSLVESRNGFAFQWLELNNTNQFELQQEPFTAAFLDNPIGLSNLAESDFQILDLQSQGPVLFEAVVSATNVLSWRELPCGWQSLGQSPIAMTAWFQNGGSSRSNEAAAVDVQVEIVPKAGATGQTESQ